MENAVQGLALFAQRRSSTSSSAHPGSPGSSAPRLCSCALPAFPSKALKKCFLWLAQQCCSRLRRRGPESSARGSGQGQGWGSLLPRSLLLGITVQPRHSPFASRLSGLPEGLLPPGLCGCSEGKGRGHPPGCPQPCSHAVAVSSLVPAGYSRGMCRAVPVERAGLLPQSERSLSAQEADLASLWAA